MYKFFKSCCKTTSLVLYHMHVMRICLIRKGAEYRIEKIILFGKYRIVSVLGSGSSGTVYLAEHLKLKVYRAIKCIPKNAGGKFSFSFEEGFPTEASLLKNLNHPGIPLIYDIDEDNDFFYITEEFIQGESLDTFVLRQESISQELIIEFGIQLCEILDYLHHCAPYPILYQDLKPEHIILCGNHLKLIDFGIATFFTGSGKHFQKFGTKDFAAPEALAGLPVTASSDLFGLGRVLAFLADHAAPECTRSLADIIAHAVNERPEQRYQSAAQMKSALLQVQTSTGRIFSHPISNIAVVGSRPGVGSTHISVSLVCVLNRLCLPALYLSADDSRTLESCAAFNRSFQEQDGIYRYGSFQGVPDYGTGVEVPLPTGHCIVRDCGAFGSGGFISPAAFDSVFFVLSGSDWDMEQSILSARSCAAFPQTVFIMNFQNKRAARRCAGLLGRKVFCFPTDCDPYHVTAEKERLVRTILKKKGGPAHIWI